MKKYIALIVTVTAVLVPILFFPSCANTTEAPTGGKKDTIPPYIIDITPLPGVVGVPLKGAKFLFTFNEYVTLKTPTNIFLSPPQKKIPKARMRGRSLEVTFEDSLKPNTTYTLSFINDAVVDANESNPFAGYSYVFSTGEKIDSMMLTGTVQDCNTLAAVKGATVVLHSDLSDSAIFKTAPYAATKTDDWGYFVLPYIKDTAYRLYALKDENNDNILDPETELVGFVDSIIRPVLTANDTVREMLKYDMLDTLSCLARRSEYEINLFRETPSKQFLVNKERLSERAAYLTFMAHNAWIDSLEIKGYRSSQIITQFNLEQDSLEIWLNSRKPAPDTLEINIKYKKTDSLGVLNFAKETVRLPLTNDRRTYSKRSRRDRRLEDTTCVFTLKADPKTVEQYGFELEFKNPIINENFDKLDFFAITPRQTQEKGELIIERDSLNLRRYTLKPKGKMQVGYEYRIKVPHEAFRDINGFYSDSSEVKVSLPTGAALSSLETVMSGVDKKYIVDLLNEKRNKVLRTYIIDKDCTLMFPYLDPGRYCIRITEDGNRNSLVDTGSIIEHRQPEKVKFYELDGEKFLTIPESSELVQTIDISELFKDN